jgi:hypothetical protein
MLRAIGSSQTHIIFIPPWHFSNLKVQRGTIIQFMLVGIAPGALIPVAPMAWPPIPVIAERSIIIAFIAGSPYSSLG